MKTFKKLRPLVVLILFGVIASPTLAVAGYDRSQFLEDRYQRIAERLETIIERRYGGHDQADTDHGDDQHDGGDHQDDSGDDNDHGSDHGDGDGDGSHQDDDDGGHGHAATIEAAEPIPTIDLVVHEDPRSGYNLEIVTEHYQFAPQNASTDHIDGEGHAHLYVDGEKITRIYGNWFYVAAMEPGEHTIRVELSSNNHSAYAHDGELIDDTEVIVVE